MKKVFIPGQGFLTITMCPPGSSALPWHLTETETFCPISDNDLLRDARQGACDDDCEVTAPYVGMCPDETDGEDVSPLDFRSTWTDTAPIVSFDASVVDSLIDAQVNRQRRPPQHKFSHRD